MGENKIILNKSFFFLLPLFEINNKKGIINTYLGDLTKGSAFNDCLYILSDRTNDEIDAHCDKVSYYETGGNHMYILRFPDKFYFDYNSFLSGKYSMYSEKAKEILCKSACRNTLKSPHQTDMYSILFKTKSRKDHIENWLDVKLEDDAEYASIFNADLEVYDG